MVGTKILIVDDVNFCAVLKTHFLAEGCEVALAHDSASALSLCKSFHPDIVVMESLLPRLDGQQTLAELRRDGDIPIVMITAKNEVFDRVLLLEMGADDVLVKPFDLKELSARIKAVLRRARKGTGKTGSDVIKFDNFEISQERFELKLCGKKVEIPPKELQLLYCLASSPNRVFSREQLLEHVWDFAFLGDSRTVDVHIKRLREKLEGVSDKWALKTVWGVGYKFELIN